LVSDTRGRFESTFKPPIYVDSGGLRCDHPACSPEDMDTLCGRYKGFYRFAQFLENLAQGIADGTIPVPE